MTKVGAASPETSRASGGKNPTPSGLRSRHPRSVDDVVVERDRPYAGYVVAGSLVKRTGHGDDDPTIVEPVAAVK